MTNFLLQVSVAAPASSDFNSDGPWWAQEADEDGFSSPIPLDGSEYGLWSGNFVPPPPRPMFLDEAVTPDGLTTCDLCSWAWEKENAYTIDAARGL